LSASPTAGAFDAPRAERFRALAVALAAGAVALSSATQLRLSGMPVGIGEALAAACVALRWLDPWPPSPAARRDERAVLEPFRRLAAAMLLAASLATVVAPWWVGAAQAAPVEQAVRNLAALWAAALFGEAVATLAVRHRIVELGATMLYATLALHVALLALALLPGRPALHTLWYEGTRFTGFAENPNQMALAMLAAGCAAAAGAERAMGAAGATLAALAFAGLLAFARSDAGLLAFAAFAALATVFALPRWITAAPRHRPSALAAAMVVIACAAVLAAIPLIDAVADRVYGEGAQGSDRLALWSSALEAGLRSPVFGLGPGAHARIDGYPGAHEAHNTWIDWWSMTGGLGTAVLVALLGTAAWRLARSGNATGLAGLAALAVFASFHLVLRQPAFWCAVGLCFAASAPSMRERD
jgi:O-antigen ligase